ncbi:MAG: hypothetical protein QOJ03_2461 [Frankiaceae bacterium]|jgi:hypothetical protein|nr:hypothetical protein [Frankiaceae bacterium]
MSVAASGPFDGHGLHTLTIAGPMAAIALVAVAADLRAWSRRRGIGIDSWLMGAAAAMSVGAATVHVVVCPEHLREAALYGAFFVTAAVLQLGWAVLAVRHRAAWVAATGVAGNVAAIALWAVTRTVGLPVGPEPGVAERVGVLDVIATAYELGVVVACSWALLRLRRASEEAAAETGIRSGQGSLVGRWDGGADEGNEIFAVNDTRSHAGAGRAAVELLVRQP